MTEEDKKEYERLKSENVKLDKEYADRIDQCAQENKSWDLAMKETYDIRHKVWLNDKRLRQLKDPAITFGKEWKGKTYTMEEFAGMCKSGELIDNDGYGYYASDKGKSDIEIMPSDITEGIVRDDFPNVVWFNK